MTPQAAACCDMQAQQQNYLTTFTVSIPPNRGGPLCEANLRSALTGKMLSKHSHCGLLGIRSAYPKAVKSHVLNTVQRDNVTFYTWHECACTCAYCVFSYLA
jgi:hypothetical protein